MADGGNNNFFKIFKGRHAITTPSGDTKYVMLSCTNDVIIMDRFTSDSNKVLFTLPPELRPLSQNIAIPCYVYRNNTNLISFIVIQTNGNVIAELANTTYYTIGLSFNISGNFYR